MHETDICLEALENISQHAYDDDTPIEDIMADFDHMREFAYLAIDRVRGRIAGSSREDARCTALEEALEAVVETYGCECVDGAPDSHCPMCQARKVLEGTSK